MLKTETMTSKKKMDFAWLKTLFCKRAKFIEIDRE